MSRSRSLLAALTALAVGATVALTAATTAPASTDTVTHAAARVRQSVSLTVNPQLAQPGTAVADPKSAKSALVAQFKPAKKGRKVVLLKKKGRKWVKVTTTKQNAKGRAEFAAPYKVRGKFQAYRVQAVKYRGLKKVTSKPKSTSTKWRTAALSDSFGGTSLPANWAHRPTAYDQGDGDGGKRRCAIADPDNIAVANGSMRLKVSRNAQGKKISDTGGGLLGLDPVYDTSCEVDGKPYDYRYTGHVSTQGRKAFTYGFAAARMKFQKDAGQHAAFWMQPADTAEPSGTEIDVIEFFGNRSNDNTELTSFVHRPFVNPPIKDRTCGQISKPSRFGDGWWSKYHVYSVEWTKSSYIFRIDGKETCRTAALISHTPQYLILSLQANDYELKYSKSLPQTMYVDWVRYWTP